MKALAYRTALVTGASSGLGRGLAAWFAKRGVRVYACARRQEQLASLAAEAKAQGGVVEPVSMDVTDTAATVKTIREIDLSCGGLDLIIANAGVPMDFSRERFTFESVQRQLSVNVMGAAATLTAVLPQMLERKRGHLVGTSSIAAYRGLPRAAAYSGAKAFLATFLEGLRVEVRRKGVQVTSLHPGFVRTEMTANGKKAQMPFLMELEPAVEKMGRAIVRGAREYAFPWQMSAVIHVAKFLPNGLWDATATKLG